MEDFLTDVQTLRKRARTNMKKGPVTDAYGADLERVIFVLNQALATAISGTSSLLRGSVLRLRPKSFSSTRAKRSTTRT